MIVAYGSADGLPNGFDRHSKELQTKPTSSPQYSFKSQNQDFSVFRATRRLLDPPTPFRCDQAVAIIATPSPTEAVFVTLIASEEI